MTSEPVNNNRLTYDPDILSAYNEDALGIRGGFEAVFRAEAEDEIMDLVKKCAADRIPVTPQGLRSSLTGASMCDKGIALSLEKMNRIIDIDVKNRCAIVEPGVITSDLKEAVLGEGLFYPPDPTSAGESTIGGNVATNASGSSALKYGSTIDWVQGLKVIDGNANLIEVKNILSEKSSTGYGLMNKPINIFIGSEGTIGIITQIEVSLTLKPPPSFLGAVFFQGLKSALDFNTAVRKDRYCSPKSMEFFDNACLNIIRPKAEGLFIPADARFMINFEQEYDDKHHLQKHLDGWYKIIKTYSEFLDNTQISSSKAQIKHLKYLRHYIPEKMNEESIKAWKKGGCKIATDWTVPYNKLHELFDYFDKIKYMLGDMTVVRFGHIGQGHPHFNFMARNGEEKKAAEKINTLMAIKAVELGGAISGEHGIGKLKRNLINIQYPEAVIKVMKIIKKEFDPKGILAPGNIFCVNSLL